MVGKSNDKLVKSQCTRLTSDKPLVVLQPPLPFSKDVKMTRSNCFKLTSEVLDLFVHKNSLFKDESFNLSPADLEKCIPTSLKRLSGDRITEDQKRRLAFVTIVEKSEVIRNRYLENSMRKQAFTNIRKIRSFVARSSITKTQANI